MLTLAIIRAGGGRRIFSKIGIGFTFFALIFGLTTPQIASATLYQPGTTLAPDCPPTESLTTCGVVTPATAGANSNITSLTGLTTALTPGQGGTGLSSYTAGDLLYAISSATLSKLAIGTDGQVLKVSSGALTWGTSASSNIGDTDLTLTSNRLLILGGKTFTFDGSSSDLVVSANGDIATGGALSVTGTTTTSGNLVTPKGSDYATTGSQNNVSLGTGSLFRYTGGSTATFTGIVGGTDGRQIRIMNVSGFNLVLNNQDTNSTDINRIITSSGSNLTIPTDVSVGLQYDAGTTNRWRVVVLPATSGTINGFAYIQGGNGFGTTATLGTTDSNGLNFITAGNTRFSLASGASTLTGTGATTLTTDAGSALTLDSGTTGALNLGTGSNAKTITIGNTTGATALNFNAGTAGITFVGSTTLQNFTATNSTTTNATTTNFAVSGTSQLGTIISGLWNGTAIGPTFGGTNQTTYTTGDVLYASGLNTLGKLAVGTAGQVLKVSGGIPTWQTDTAASVNGKWATSTDNLSTYTSTLGQVVLVGSSATSTTGNILEVTGNSLFTGSANITGNLQLGTVTSGAWNGTAVGPTYGGTNQTSYTTGDILYASAANTLNKLPVGGSGTVLTTVGGVPAWAASVTGATINGKWATSTDSLVTYTISPIEVVVIGASATTSLGHSLGAKLEVTGNSLFSGTTYTTGLTTLTGGFISSASSTVASSLNVSGMLGASTTLQSTGAVRFYSTGQFDGLLTLASAGTGLSVTNNATVGGTLGVTGLTTLGNASTTLLSVSNSLFVNGNATTTSNGNMSTAGTITAAGLLTASNGLTLSSGTLTLPSASIADASLSSNVALLNRSGQTFSSTNTFTGLTTLGNASTTQLTTSGYLYVTGTTTASGNFVTPKGSDYSTTGTQNNVNLGTGSLFRYTGGSTATFTGISGGIDGRQIRIMNASGFNLVLNNLDSNSTASNQIVTSSGSNLTIPNNVSVGLQYDSGSSVWRVVVLPATSGTINGFAFVQSGNAFGAAANLGTTDSNGLNFITGGSTRFTVAAGASTLTGNSATTLAGGTTLALTSAAGSDLNVTSGTTGALNLDSGSTGAVNLGTNSNAKTITIGNGTGATSLVLNAGTGNIDIGANAFARTINLGTGAAVVETINVGGTGANVIGVGNTQTGGSVAIGGAMTSGTIDIGNSNGAMTGTINVGGSTGAQTLNFAGGSTGIKTVNIAGGTAANVVAISNTQTAGSVSIGAAMTGGTISIGGTGAQTGTIGLGTGTGTQTVNIATGAGVKTVTLGSTNGASITTINAGTGGYFLTTNLGAQTNGKRTLCWDTTTFQLFKGNSANSCDTSSARYKHDIVDIGTSLGIDAVMALRPVSYAYNSDNEKGIGFIAEEVALVDDRLAVYNDGIIDGINSDRFVPILTKAIQEQQVLIGNISPKINSDGSDNGLSTLVATIQSETSHDPIAIITAKITSSKQFLTDLIVARVTAIRGYFDEMFARKIHTEQICVKKTDGGEVCVNGDQLQTIVDTSGGSPVDVSVQSAAVEPTPASTPDPTPVPAPETPPTVAPVPADTSPENELPPAESLVPQVPPPVEVSQ